jgi:hypothetical protein
LAHWGLFRHGKEGNKFDFLLLQRSANCHNYLNHQPFKDEAQTALFKDPVRTAL